MLEQKVPLAPSLEATKTRKNHPVVRLALACSSMSLLTLGVFSIAEGAQDKWDAVRAGFDCVPGQEEIPEVAVICEYSDRQDAEAVAGLSAGFAELLAGAGVIALSGKRIEEL